MAADSSLRERAEALLEAVELRRRQQQARERLAVEAITRTTTPGPRAAQPEAIQPLRTREPAVMAPEEEGWRRSSARRVNIDRRKRAMQRLGDAQAEILAQQDPKYDSDPLEVLNRSRAKMGLPALQKAPKVDAGLLAGLRRGLSKKEAKVAFVGGFFDLEEPVAASRAAARVQSGQETPEDLETLAAFAEKSAIGGRDRTTRGIIGETLAAMPTFILEIGATAGTIPLARRTVSGLAQKAAGGVLRRAATRGAQLATIAGLTSVTQPGRVAARIAERRVPTAGLDEAARVIAEMPDEHFLTSVARGLGDVYTENLSEFTGGLLPIKVPFVRRLIEKAGNQSKLAGKLLSAHAAGAQTLRRVGLNDVLQEVGEERVKDVMDEVLGIRDVSLPDAKQIVAELASFSVLPAGRVAAGSVPVLRDKLAKWMAGRKLTDVRDLAESTPSRKQFAKAGLVGIDDAAEREQVQAWMRQYFGQTIKALPPPPAETAAPPAPKAPTPSPEVRAPEPTPAEPRQGAEVEEGARAPLQARVLPQQQETQVLTPEDYERIRQLVNLPASRDQAQTQLMVDRYLALARSIRGRSAEQLAADPEFAPLAAEVHGFKKLGLRRQATPRTLAEAAIRHFGKPEIREIVDRLTGPLRPEEIAESFRLSQIQEVARQRRLEAEARLDAIFQRDRYVMAGSDVASVVAGEEVREGQEQYGTAQRTGEWARPSYAFPDNKFGREAAQAVQSELMRRGLSEGQARYHAGIRKGRTVDTTGDEDAYRVQGAERLADAIMAYRAEKAAHDPRQRAIAAEDYILANSDLFSPEEVRDALTHRSYRQVGDRVESVPEVRVVQASELRPGDRVQVAGQDYVVEAMDDPRAPVVALNGEVPIYVTTDGTVPIDAGTWDQSGRVLDVAAAPPLTPSAPTAEEAAADFQAALAAAEQQFEQEDAAEAGAQLLIEGGAEKPALTGTQREIEFGSVSSAGVTVTATGRLTAEGKLVREVPAGEQPPNVEGQLQAFGVEPSEEQRAEDAEEHRMGGSGGSSGTAASRPGNYVSYESRESGTVAFEVPLRRLPMTELVYLVEQVGGSRPLLRKLRKNLGIFKWQEGRATYELIVDPRVPVEQRAQVLAHEIGHFKDWLPDFTLRRGKITGRLAKLHKYMREIVSASPRRPTLTKKQARKLREDARKEAGKHATRDQVDAIYFRMLGEQGQVTRQDLTDELWELSKWWKPLPKDPDPKYLKYRQKSEELYADAISVLLNSPGDLESRAPLFFHAMLAYMEKEPQFAQTYGEIQQLLNGDPEDLSRLRTEQRHKMWAQTSKAVKQIVEERRAAEMSTPSAIRDALIQGIVDRGFQSKRAVRKNPLLRQVRVLEQVLRRFENPLADINRVITLIQRTVHDPLIRLGLTLNDIDDFMFMRRIYRRDAQDRAVLGNPLGYTPEESAEELAALQRRLGPERFRELERRMLRMSRILLIYMGRAVKAGTLSPDVYRDVVLPNWDKYAPFAVLDYFHGSVPALIRNQIGTFKNIASPYLATNLKLVSIEYYNLRNEATQVTVDNFRQFMPQDVGREQRLAPGQELPRAAAKPGMAWVGLARGGVRHAVEVPELTAKYLNHEDIDTLKGLTNLLAFFNKHVWYRLYILASPVFSVYNPFRDIMRSSRGLYALSRARARAVRRELQAQGVPWWKRRALSAREKIRLREVVPAYLRAAPAALARARGEQPTQLRRMQRERTLGVHPFYAELRGEVSAIPPDRLRTFLLERYGFMPEETPATDTARWLVPLRKMMDLLEGAATFTEGLSKIAADNILRAKGWEHGERIYTIDQYVGTPSIMRRGLWHPLTNGLFLFSRIHINGMVADARLATDPKTAADAWLWYGTRVFLPVVATWAATRGYFGSWVKESLAGIPDSLLEGFYVLPLGPDPEDPDKSLVLKAPMDQPSRLVASLTMRALDAAFGEEPIGAAGTKFVGEALAIGAPNLTPTIGLPLKWAHYASGRNPIDDYYGTPVVPDRQFKAGGLHALAAMGRWTLGQFGIIGSVTNLAADAVRGFQDQTTWEIASRAGRIVGLGALVTSTNRGRLEEEWEDLEAEDSDHAQFTLDWIPRGVLRLRSEYYRLGRLDEKTERQTVRYFQVVNFRTMHDLPLTEKIKNAVSAGREEEARKYQELLEEAAKQVGQDPIADVVPMARRIAEPPRKPQRPKFGLSAARNRELRRQFQQSQQDYQEHSQRYAEQSRVALKWLKDSGLEEQEILGAYRAWLRMQFSSDEPINERMSRLRKALRSAE